MSWEVVWNIADVGFEIWVLLFAPLALVMFGLMSIKFGSRAFGAIVALGGGVSFAVLSAPYLVNYYEIQRDLKNHTFQKVEGPVTKFHPGSEVNDPNRSGSHIESFEVNGVLFSYHHRNACFCFNRTAAVGGPISEGIYVRIWHVDYKVVHLEIRRL